MLKYLKERIVDEVDDAIGYMTKALEHKGTKDGCVFRKLADAELEHANALTNMFHEEDRPESMTSDEYAEIQKAVLDKYTTAMGQIEAMKKLYWS